MSTIVDSVVGQPDTKNPLFSSMIIYSQVLFHEGSSWLKHENFTYAQKISC